MFMWVLWIDCLQLLKVSNGLSIRIQRWWTSHYYCHSTVLYKVRLVGGSHDNRTWLCGLLFTWSALCLLSREKTGHSACQWKEHPDLTQLIVHEQRQRERETESPHKVPVCTVLWWLHFTSLCYYKIHFTKTNIIIHVLNSSLGSVSNISLTSH